MESQRKVTHTAIVEGAEPREEVQFLVMYRAAPLCSIGKTPAELLFNWQLFNIHTQILVLLDETEYGSTKVCEQDKRSKNKMKE